MLKTLDGITRETFNDLLEWLDRDREEAARKYEEIRHGLVKVFAWRRCRDPEGMADCVINRVAPKVRKLRTDYEGDPVRYFHGVARNLLKEYQKGLDVEVPLTNLQMADALASAERTAELERLDSCLRSCLKQLSGKQRQQIISYYGYEKSEKVRRRREMARRLGIEQNALRVRMHRVRAVLEKCIRRCMAKTTI
jgi:RNA polymerase sigma factor (sigma-70 family)